MCARTRRRRCARPAAAGPAAAGRAGDALGAGLGPVTVAGHAGGGDLDLDGALDAGEGVGELDRNRNADIAAALAAAAVPGEEIVAEEGGEDVAQVREGEVGWRVAAAAEAGVPVLVVEPAPLGVREHLVRLGDGAEALLRVGVAVHVGVKLARERAERLLDLGVARAARRRRAARSSRVQPWPCGEGYRGVSQVTPVVADAVAPCS